ncbi:AGE family epimerase/isomerase [Brevundimonas sp. 2R-24]|uniref:AGE family epimerase/isomerase n=1 Tax=Peiella sedimenti TaxID=3061083 RepID=A0ABT8SH86_9CAUL|nr:AGE family epimerase/isomerase [Caulobacteraceae bacterium XZ-24]
MIQVDLPLEHIRRWMFGAALPLWAEAGVDRRHGGYVEQLDFRGRDAGADLKRTRVTCRQIYVFSHAALLGWDRGDEAARHGLAFLDRAWLGPDRGFARALTREGKIADATPDLYDLAFCLFALSWRQKLGPDAAAMDRCLQTLDFIDTRMRGPGGGFLHALPAEGPRRQNPHMHLLEAALVGWEATGHPRFEALARELVELFCGALFDGRTLREHFGPAWERLETDEGRITEPGHQFEWAWILSEYGRLSGGVRSEAIRALVAGAEAHGVDPATHATFQQVRDDGTPLDRSSRCWPNTERLKAQVALSDTFGDDVRSPLAGSANLLLDRYLATEIPGLWVDQFDAEGQPMSRVVPASTLYHLFLAFAETLRIAPRLVG